MPAKPAPIKKAPAKKAEKAPEPPAEPAPEAPPAEAPPAEAPPAEAAPAEAAPAEAAPAPAEGEVAPAAEAAPAPEDAPAPAAEEAPAPAAAEPPADAADAPAEAPPAPAPEAEAPPAPEAEAPPAPAPEAEAPPAEAPAEAPAAPAAEEPAPAPEAAAPVEAAAPAEEGAAPAAAPAEGEEAPAEAAPAPADAAAPAAEEGAAPAAEGEAAPAAEGEAAPAEAAPAEAPAEDAAAAAPAAEAPAEGAAAEAPAEAAPAEAAPAPVEEPPKPPTPPPPPEPTSAPLDLTLEDVNDTSVTLRWKAPEAIGDSGLDGYTVEHCKKGGSEWVVANADLTVATRMVVGNLTTGDILEMRVVAVNPGGRSEPCALAEAVTVREVGERPKVRLPRALRARVVRKVGAQINLVIPFCGKPKPLVSWTKDGEPLDTKRVGIRNSNKDSIFFIRTSEREDSGVYEISVKVDSFVDTANITIQIVDLPGPPESVKLVDTWGFNAALEWTVPKDSGNTEITGYSIQKADKKTGEWFTVLEHYHRLNATVSDLIMGNSYNFRVFAENKVGISESAAVTKEVAEILKTGIVYQPPEYQEHDFSEAPKFTAALNDRAATVGYTTKLLCSVRGCPKPKIEWLKNQMVIGDDPKYRQLNNLGVCSLEIRKPCSFDGGVYTCRAKNEQGTATVSCKLEVKQVLIPEK